MVGVAGRVPVGDTRRQLRGQAGAHDRWELRRASDKLAKDAEVLVGELRSPRRDGVTFALDQRHRRVGGAVAHHHRPRDQVPDALSLGMEGDEENPQQVRRREEVDDAE
ncbi:MAG: hypothetical protein IPF47_08860 [Gemmatimonadetes bacterium]|nr:hypothetical protein [Gemmatimonadota bacterium]